MNFRRMMRKDQMFKRGLLWIVPIIAFVILASVFVPRRIE